MQGENSCFSIRNWNRVKVLGRGSYGVVFLAAASSTTGGEEPVRFVALKAALIEHSSSLMMEKDILQTHFTACPEIVQCLGSGMTFEGGGAVVYNLALEYAAGGTLADLIKQRQKLPESEAKECLRMILRGLSCIHARGFVHGDLKPANILVFPKPDGGVQLKIADFGLSRRCGEESEAVVVPKFRGTPKYMSAESVVFGKVDTALDVWSLGCVLIEMVSGRSVWSECRDKVEVMRKLVYEMAIPEVPEELSREGRDFLAGCLDQDWERRWTADMLLRHPYVYKGLELEIEELLKGEKGFEDGSCFEDVCFGKEKKAAAAAAAKENENGEMMPSVLTPNDEIFQIAQLIGFPDFVL